MSKNPLN